MDIEKLLKQAADYCDNAGNTMRYLMPDRIAFAQIADACAKCGTRDDRIRAVAGRALRGGTPTVAGSAQ